MQTKTLIWLGMSIGSIIGGFLPALWGGDYFSMAGILCSGIGGLAGIWLGFKVGQGL